MMFAAHIVCIIILLECEDAGLTDIELRELLLPSDLMEPGDVRASSRCSNECVRIACSTFSVF
jgi:hypothetical protein